MPHNPKDDLKDPHWKKAMTNEYTALTNNDTWELFPRPSNVNVIRYMLIFFHKTNAEGSF